MGSHSSATTSTPPLVSRPEGSGLWWGFLGVGAFSLTVPFTRVAVGGLSPLFVGSGRAVVAGLLGLAALALSHQRLPQAAQWPRIVVAGGGIVVGFPLLTSFALVSAPASHGAVVIAVLPAATAVAAVLRTGDHPPLVFWVAAGTGTTAALCFAVIQSGGLDQVHWADLLLFGAVVSAAVGYAEGGMLARELGAWQTVCWALVACAPLMTVLMAVSVIQDAPRATRGEWLAFGYLGLVSMFLGFFAWYRGLAIGPMAQVSQVQLVQPVLSITWAGILLGEHITAATVVGGLVVVACAATAVRARSR
jgi:drug/metabolite transporter (DMT)-like permease